MATHKDFEEALHRTLLWDQTLYDALIPALEARRRFEKKEWEEPTPGANARMLLSSALRVAAKLVGEEAMAEAYGADPDPQASRRDHLEAMWWRLVLISDIYGFQDYKSPSSIFALQNEIMAIMNGDAADILREFPGKQKRPRNGWRLAQRKLAAFEWEAFLRGQGSTPAEAQGTVCTAFGPGLQWSTIRRWKPTIIKELGQSSYDRGIAAAERGVSLYSSASIYHSERENSEALAEDGEKYRAELRRQVRVVSDE